MGSVVQAEREKTWLGADWLAGPASGNGKEEKEFVEWMFICGGKGGIMRGINGDCEAIPQYVNRMTEEKVTEDGGRSKASRIG